MVGRDGGRTNVEYSRKVKVNFVLEEATKAKRESRYISTLSLTSALDGFGWLNPLLCCFTPWKETRYPLYRRLSGPQGLSGRLRKISPLPGFDPRTVDPVAQWLY